MTNTTVSRLGSVNAAGATDALFLKVFAGEVLAEFEKATDFKDKHRVKSITSGKSAQFPMIGTATGGYHTPGTWIDGTTIGHAEKVITIDAKLYSSVFISDIDEAMNHYDVRGPYSSEVGVFLAQTFDQNVARCMVLAARAANPLTGRAGGTRISNLAMDTDKDVLRASLFTAAQRLDEKNVSKTGRNAFFRPAQFYVMAQDVTLINQFYRGSGDISKGTLPTAAGFDIVKTNNLPAANDTANAALQTKYRADYSTTMGLVAHMDAAATVKLMDLSMESQREPRRQGTFIIATYAVGHDWLRPECAVELYKA